MPSTENGHLKLNNPFSPSFLSMEQGGTRNGWAGNPHDFVDGFADSEPLNADVHFPILKQMTTH